MIEYADDTLTILPADRIQLLALKDMLQVFAQSTGLDVNYRKSFLIPINVDPIVMNDLAAAFGCQIGKMPFTYLGLPVGTTRPKMVDFMPLVDCMERRMTASSSFLNQGERLQFLNSALSSMPIFFMCSLAVPAGILKQLERIQRQCLWRKNRDEPAPSLAAWELICRPKNRVVLVFSIWGYKMLPCSSNMLVTSSIKMIFLGYLSFGTLTTMEGCLKEHLLVALSGGRIFARLC